MEAEGKGDRKDWNKDWNDGAFSTTPVLLMALGTTTTAGRRLDARNRRRARETARHLGHVHAVHGRGGSPAAMATTMACRPRRRDCRVATEIPPRRVPVLLQPLLFPPSVPRRPLRPASVPAMWRADDTARISAAGMSASQGPTRSCMHACSWMQAERGKVGER